MEVLPLVEVFPPVVELVVLLPDVLVEVFVVELLEVLLPEVLVFVFVFVEVFQVLVEVLVVVPVEVPVVVLDPVDAAGAGNAVSSPVIKSSVVEVLADAIKSTDPIRSVLIPVIPKATISFLEKREYMAENY